MILVSKCNILTKKIKKGAKSPFVFFLNQFIPLFQRFHTSQYRSQNP